MWVELDRDMSGFCELDVTSKVAWCIKTAWLIRSNFAQVIPEKEGSMLENPYKLAPIGTLGEVVIQSPTILREYLDDFERTKASTMYELPSWAPWRDQYHWS